MEGNETHSSEEVRAKGGPGRKDCRIFFRGEFGKIFQERAGILKKDLRSALGKEACPGAVSMLLAKERPGRFTTIEAGRDRRELVGTEEGEILLP